MLQVGTTKPPGLEFELYLPMMRTASSTAQCAVCTLCTAMQSPSANAPSVPLGKSDATALQLHFKQCPFPNRSQFGSETNLKKIYKIYRTELDSVRKQKKTYLSPEKNSEPNSIRFGKKVAIF